MAKQCSADFNKHIQFSDLHFCGTKRLEHFELVEASTGLMVEIKPFSLANVVCFVRNV